MKSLVSDAIEEVQDTQSLKASLLVIQDALETGVWSKSFILYNDSWVTEVMRNIATILSEKYNIKVPDSEI